MEQSSDGLKASLVMFEERQGAYVEGGGGGASK